VGWPRRFRHLEKSDRRRWRLAREQLSGRGLATCPRIFYSFSFAQRLAGRTNTPPADILDYLEVAYANTGSTDTSASAPRSPARTGTRRALWVVRTQQGDVFEAQSLVPATGQLSRPYTPAIPGIEISPGRFPFGGMAHDCDLAGNA